MLVAILDAVDGGYLEFCDGGDLGFCDGGDLGFCDGGDLGFCDGGDAEKAESCPRRSEWVGSGWSRESREGGEVGNNLSTTNYTTTQNY